MIDNMLVTVNTRWLAAGYRSRAGPGELLGGFAVAGLSLPRDNYTSTGLPLDAALTTRGAEPRCGVMFIELRNGDALHWLRFGGVARELYDVAALSWACRLAAIGFKDADIRQVITVSEALGWA